MKQGIRFICWMSLFLALEGFSQSIKVSGIVVDSVTHRAIPNVNIAVDASKIGTSTDANGKFSLVIPNNRSTIKISHVGFKTQQKLIYRVDTQLVIQLKAETKNLGIVEISSNRITNLVEKKNLYVIDYLIFENKICVLCFKNRQSQQAQLVLLDGYGNQIESKEMEWIDKIVNDYKLEPFLTSKKSALQILILDSIIAFGNEIEMDEFNEINEAIIAYQSPFYYIRHNYYDNQLVRIYRYNEQNQEVKLLKSITDSAGIERLKDKARLQSALDYTEADARFEEMCFYAPKYLPLIYFDTSFLLFNFNENRIEKLDKQGNTISNTAIEFHQQPDWKQDLLIDSVQKKIYAVFAKNGQYKIAEIDLQLGKIGNKINIPHFQHLENMQINNGRLYFLYQGNIDNRYKELYCMYL